MKLVMRGATRAAASVEAVAAAVATEVAAAAMAVEVVEVVVATVVAATTAAAVATEVVAAAMVAVVTVAVAAIEVAAMEEGATITIVATKAEKTGETQVVGSMVDRQDGATITLRARWPPDLTQEADPVTAVTAVCVAVAPVDLPHSQRVATPPLLATAVKGVGKGVGIVVVLASALRRVNKALVNFRLPRPTPTTRRQAILRAAMASVVAEMASGVIEEAPALEVTEVVVVATPSTSRKTLRAWLQDLLTTSSVLRLQAKAKVLSRLSTSAISITRRLRTR